jgi:FMN phosphatase YigB (HAD superfamily)
MSTTESITKAIAAHGLWKTRLKEAVATGSSLFRPDAVKLDNACDFGKWLYSMTPAQRDAGWEKIKGLHAAFHLEASKILALALTGKKAEVVVGKPSHMMIQAALGVMGFMPEDCILIGDSMETDIRMGKDFGMATGIVLTGVTDEKTLEGYKHTSFQPDFVFQSIADVDDLMIG